MRFFIENSYICRINNAKKYKLWDNNPFGAFEFIEESLINYVEIILKDVLWELAVC